MSRLEKLKQVPSPVDIAKGNKGTLSARATKEQGEERKALLRGVVEDSQPLVGILQDLQSVMDLRKEISLGKPSSYDKERVAKYGLLHTNLKLALDAKFKLLAKLLPDEKELALEGAEQLSLPSMTLRIVKVDEPDEPKLVE